MSGDRWAVPAREFERGHLVVVGSPGASKSQQIVVPTFEAMRRVEELRRRRHIRRVLVLGLAVLSGLLLWSGRRSLTEVARPLRERIGLGDDAPVPDDRRR